MSRIPTAQIVAMRAELVGIPVVEGDLEKVANIGKVRALLAKGMGPKEAIKAAYPGWSDEQVAALAAKMGVEKTAFVRKALGLPGKVLHYGIAPAEYAARGLSGGMMGGGAGALLGVGASKLISRLAGLDPIKAAALQKALAAGGGVLGAGMGTVRGVRGARVSRMHRRMSSAQRGQLSEAMKNILKGQGGAPAKPAAPTGFGRATDLIRRRPVASTAAGVGAGLTLGALAR
jgi:hypothetical protein